MVKKVDKIPKPDIEKVKLHHKQIYHFNATTNINIRTQIQTYSVTNSELASRFKVFQQTISKWRNRDFVEDVYCAPRTLNML